MNRLTNMCVNVYWYDHCLCVEVVEIDHKGIVRISRLNKRLDFSTGLVKGNCSKLIMPFTCH